MNPSEYEVMYRIEDRHWWYGALREVVRDALRTHGPGRGRLLDAGCGTGANLAQLADGYEAVGIDAAVDAIRFCRQRGLEQTAAGSITELPFPDNSFDVVVSCDVLCHRSIRDKAAGFRELARVTAPGGVVIVNLPAFQWLYSSHDVAVHTDHRFHRRETGEYLKQANLEPLGVNHWNSVLFPAMCAVRLLRRIRPPAESDLASGSGSALSPLLYAALHAERTLGRFVEYPVGLSILAVARKPLI